MPETTPGSKKIDKLVQRIEDGEIKIPAFQREFVWTQEQITKLLESIYNDYPIGSILFWNTRDRMKSTRDIAGFILPERPEAYPVDYVLDGQQRLVTIYGVFARERNIQFSENDYYRVNHELFDIYFDLDTKEFIGSHDINTKHKNFKMNVLFDVNEFHNAVTGLDKEKKKVAQDLQSRFSNYEIPIVTTYKRDRGEVGIIFERINSTGTNLTTLDLMIAWTWTEDFHLREKFNEIQSMLSDKNFEDVPDKVLLQCLSAIIKKTTVTKEILRLEPEEVRNSITTLQDGLERAIDFLFTQLNVKSRDFLPHIQQLVPLVFIFSKKRHLSENTRGIIKKWFWKTSFSKRYSASTDTKMDEDISFFEDIIDGKSNYIQKYIPEISAEILKKQRFSKSNPYTRAFLLLMAQKAPRDITNGSKIDIEMALSKYNRKEYHHFFPKKFLKEKGYGDSDINSLLNICFLPSSSNKKISDKSPSIYIKKISKKKYDDIMKSNLMPTDKKLYVKNNYENFLNTRAEIIIELTNKLTS